MIELAGVHNPQQAAAIIGKTAQLELYDLEPALVSPSVTVTGQPGRDTNLYQLLSRVQAAAKTGAPSRYVLFRPEKVTTTTGTGKNRKTTTTTVWVRAAGPTAQLHRDPRPGNAGLLDPYARQDPEGRQGAAGAAPDAS